MSYGLQYFALLLMYTNNSKQLRLFIFLSLNSNYNIEMSETGPKGNTGPKGEEHSNVNPSSYGINFRYLQITI